MPGFGEMMIPPRTWFSTRFLVMTSSLTPMRAMPDPNAVSNPPVGERAAFALWLSYTLLPANTPLPCGASPSLSRVLGTMPVRLLRHTEFTTKRLPLTLVPE